MALNADVLSDMSGEHSLQVVKNRKYESEKSSTRSPAGPSKVKVVRRNPLDEAQLHVQGQNPKTEPFQSYNSAGKKQRKIEIKSKPVFTQLHSSFR